MSPPNTTDESESSPLASGDVAPGPDLPDRRAALGRIALAAGCALGAAAMVGPAGVALSPLLRPAAPTEGTSGDGWMRVDGVARFVIGATPARVVLRRDVRDQWLVRRGETLGAVLVERLADRNFRVLSSVCPHLGCSVVWQDDRSHWFCPCHKSAFARDGALVPAESGPPNPSPRALDPLEWRITNAQLEVRWVRFQTGVSERVPLADAGHGDPAPADSGGDSQRRGKS